MDWDLGDVVASFNLRVKGLIRRKVVWHVGPVADTSPADRVVHGPRTCMSGRKDLVLDLQADKKVALSVDYTDEVGNPVEAPEGATVTYTVDAPDIINLTDNGDGSAVAAAVGTLGVANVHVDASDPATGDHLTGDLQIVVVAGLAERLNIVTGEPEEVTPDEEPEPTP